MIQCIVTIYKNVWFLVDFFDCCNYFDVRTYYCCGVSITVIILCLGVNAIVSYSVYMNLNIFSKW